MKFFSTTAQILSAGVLLAVVGPATAQPAFPNKPIHIIVPYAPGGTATLLPFMIGPKMTESWGQQVVVDHRPGGNTVIGTEAVYRSPPDGHTLLLVSGGHITTPMLLPTRYDPIKDFAPLATLVNPEYMLVVNPSVPAKTLKELIALAKAKPGQLNFASSSAGGPNHLAGELFNMMANIKIQHVPYKGGGDALRDLIGGQIEMYFGPVANVIPYVNTGRLRAIASSGESRSPELPLVPTFSEAGLPGYVVTNWYGMFAPSATPKAIIDKLAAEITRIVQLPDSKEKLRSGGMVPFTSTPEQFAALLQVEKVKLAKVIEFAKIKIDN